MPMCLVFLSNLWHLGFVGFFVGWFLEVGFNKKIDILLLGFFLTWSRKTCIYYTYTRFDYICMTLVLAFAFGYNWGREVSSSQFRGPWDPRDLEEEWEAVH